ncbi:hypothetical protein T484DRAFT_1882571, partial [Baffinella frigidus]
MRISYILIVWKYFSGGSLADSFQKLRASGSGFGDDDIWSTMRQASAGLEHIHRDLKTSHNAIAFETILFDNYGVLRLSGMVPDSIGAGLNRAALFE